MNYLNFLGKVEFFSIVYIIVLKRTSSLSLTLFDLFPKKLPYFPTFPDLSFYQLFTTISKNVIMIVASTNLL
jgi:hypothetical protein